MAKLIAVCVGLGALSLVLPSEASYDPWAWLVWGREVAHLHLETTGGPSWKPLPVLVTALSSPLSKLDSGLLGAIWMTVARAGSLLALALYALPALAIWCVLAGVGLGQLLRVRHAGMSVGVATVVVLAFAAGPSAGARVERLRVEAHEVGRRMDLHRYLVDAVRHAGGATAVNRFGPATVNRALETHLAWELGRPLSEIESANGQGVVFSSFREFLAGRRPVRRPADAIPLARVGSWNVYLREMPVDGA